MIACIRIPAFVAALEESDNPRLVGQAFALVDVRAGMTLRQAQSICPELQLLAASPVRVHRAAAEIGEMLSGFTPLVEMEATPPRLVRGRRRPQPAIGSDDGAAIWFANPGRMLPNQGKAFAESVQAALLRQTRLAATIGLAANRFTARVAAGAIDLGACMLVRRDTERDFLASFPVALLPIYVEQDRQLRLLDGAAHPGDLIRRAAELEMPALALTDHDAVYAAQAG